MYEEFFGFSKRPFNVTPDPKLLFMTDSHQEALASLLYGIRERKGFISVSGEVGTGKTTLLNYLLTILDKNIKTIFIYQTRISFEDLLREILRSLALRAVDGTKASMMRRLSSYLYKAYERNENLAILIDEAQNLSEELLEELRMLSNIETGEAKLFQIVLVGQPELEVKLNHERLRQLRQRIGIRRQIRPLTEEESHQYIEDRLEKMGSRWEDIFSEDALDLVCRYADGIFRQINIICDNAFLIGYALKRKPIDDAIIREVLADLGLILSKGPLPRRQIPMPEKNLFHPYQPLATAEEFDSPKHSHLSKWWSAPRAFGVLSVGLALYFGGSYLFGRTQSPSTLDPSGQSLNKTDDIRNSTTKGIEPTRNPSGVSGRGKGEILPSSPIPKGSGLESKTERRKASKEETQGPLINEARVTNTSKGETVGAGGAHLADRPESGSHRTVEVPEGEFLYSLAAQHYKRSNPTILDYVLDSNPAISNIHQLQAKQRVIFPEINEESLLRGLEDGVWRIHLGTFPDASSAEVFRREAILRGKDITVAARQVAPQEKWYRVFAGKFETKEEGLNVIRALRHRKLLPALEARD